MRGSLMKEECLICKAPLEYLNEDVLMECAICHKKELSKTRCVNGHYVCNECHTKGIDSIFGVCLTETSKNPVEILNKMMNLPFCHMHGPEHHIVVGAALLTAYKNAGGDIDLSKALTEMKNRGQSVPGGACGFWGACGAGISSGMFVSIISGSTPLAGEPFGLSNRMTAKSLDAIGSVGGPRCCKRDSYLSILSAIDFVKEHLPFTIRSAFGNFCDRPLRANLARSSSLVFQSIHFHLVRKRLFARKNVLPLQVAVHHRDDGFLIREISYDHRHGAHAESTAGSQSAVAGYQLVAALRGSCKRGDQHTRFPDAFFQSFHFFILHDFKRVILERFQFVKGKLVHLRFLRIEPFLCAHKELIVPGQAQVYAVCFHASSPLFLRAVNIVRLFLSDKLSNLTASGGAVLHPTVRREIRSWISDPN